jgi:hypothetical protein
MTIVRASNLPVDLKVRDIFRNLCLFAFLLAAGLAVWPFHSARAVPANPEPVEIVQPDGTKFKMRIRGDEYFSWHETVDGYAVVKDADGFWKYAQPATDRVAFVAIPTARVGTTDQARHGLRKQAMPDARMLREFIEKRRQAMMGEPEELPVPGAVTNRNVKQTEE